MTLQKNSKNFLSNTIKSMNLTKNPWKINLNSSSKNNYKIVPSIKKPFKKSNNNDK